MTFRRRIVLLSALAVAGAIVIASVLTYLLVSHNLRGQIDSELRGDVPRVLVVSRTREAEGEGGAEVARRVDREQGDDDAGASAPAPSAPLNLPSAPADDVAIGRTLVVPPSTLGGASVLAQTIGTTGGVRGDARLPMLPVTPAVREVAAGTRAPFFRDATLDGTRVRIYATRDPAGNALQVARGLTDTDNTLSELRIVLGLVALAGGLVAGLIGLLVARGALRPVARLTETTERVSETLDLSHRIEERGDDELARLSHSFNTMLSALAESRDAQRQLVADASHELRTPLTSIRANIELLQRAPEIDGDERAAMLDDARTQLEELTVLVGDLVDLARPAGQAVDEPEVLRLDVVVGEEVARARRHAGAVELVVEAEPCEVVGSLPRMHRAVANLLDNAIKWSPDGGIVEVRVQDGAIAVRDHGPGIAPADLPHVFDRFWRAPDARGVPGSGLGLAIVRQVAQTHGGTADAGPAAGGGTVVRLTLPTADPAVLLGAS